ncbi:MAG: 5'/3'-nucleotidase SurE [Pseudomonadota bacterium]|nr:5'/3'-nucleotidase SurE [Pseudomonadota bacterium]
MYKKIDNLSKSRILLSNDDGIHSPGLAIMEQIARSISDDVWVVAPNSEQSGTGHSITLRRPIHIYQKDEKKYSIEGTPTDCVLIAIQHIMKGNPPDLILSGINSGANLGEDVHYSGTVAAAVEGTLQGIPSIAFSLIGKKEYKWQVPNFYSKKIIEDIYTSDWKKNILFNINFPDIEVNDIKGIKFASQGRHKIGDNLIPRKNPRGQTYIWIGATRVGDLEDLSTDVSICDNGYISITPLNIDQTHYETLKKLSVNFKQ